MKKYAIPEKYENRSDEFEVCVGAEKLGVYSCRVSAYPFNQVWPGYQRPIDQTEKSSFVMLGSNKEVVLKVKPKNLFGEVKIRPTVKKIKTLVSEGVFEVTFPGPGQYSIECGNMHNVLTVFVNPEKNFNILTDKNVIYFGPGIHYLDSKIILEDNQTVFIDEGAVVYGGIFAQNKTNISVIGYGILDCSRMERLSEIASLSADEMGNTTLKGNPIFFSNCKNIRVEGITIVDSAEWSVRFGGCDNIIVDNIKLIGMWRYNADGCDFCNCTNAIIRNSYLRNFDDCIVVKGLNYDRKLPVENVVAENCVLWCDWGNAIKIGSETCAPYMRNISFKECYIIHCCGNMMGIIHGDTAAISDVLFENINIEYTGEENPQRIQARKEEVYKDFEKVFIPSLFMVQFVKTDWSTDDGVGTVSNVKLSNINIFSNKQITPAVNISGNGANENSSNINFEKILINGKDYKINL